MAISDYFIDDQTGASFLDDINDQLAAIKSNNSATSTGGNPTGISLTVYDVEGFLWYDTTNDVLNVRSGTAWVVVQTGPIVGDDLDSDTAGNGKGARTVEQSSTTPTGGASGDIVYQYD